MKLFRLQIAAIFLILQATKALAIPSNWPVLVRPGGTAWRAHSRLIVNPGAHDISENGQTEFKKIVADDVVINGEILTRGRPLQVLSRQIQFTNGGRVRSFDAPAPSLPNQPGRGSPPRSQPKASGSVADGAVGTAGFDGIDGDQNPVGPHAGMTLPGDILIFGNRVNSTASIDGRGQDGGRGQNGGEGQGGGRGGDGRDARVECGVLSGGTPAGNGGNGGSIGWGGRGGIGGNPGSSVPITFLQGFSAADLAVDTSQLTSSPGSAGASGSAGNIGSPSSGGIGGRGDSLVCMQMGFTSHAIRIGPFSLPIIRIPIPIPVPRSLPAGRNGANITVSPEMLLANRARVAPQNTNVAVHAERRVFAEHSNEMEYSRYDVSRQWYKFHIDRARVLLIDRTNQLLENMEALPALLASWNEHYIAPLREARDRILSTDRAQQDYSFAQTDLPSFLSEAESLKEIIEDLTQSRIDLGTARERLTPLKVAAHAMRLSRLGELRRSCRTHIRRSESFVRRWELRIQRMREGVGSTAPQFLNQYLNEVRDQFAIPACNGAEAGAAASTQPLERFRNDLLANIELVQEPSTYPAPSNQPEGTYEVIPPREVERDFAQLQKPVPSLLEIFGIILPAWAQSPPQAYNVVIVDHRPLSPLWISEGAPHLNPNVTSSGVVVGYQAPQTASLTSTSIAFELRSLAYEIGALL